MLDKESQFPPTTPFEEQLVNDLKEKLSELALNEAVKEQVERAHDFQEGEVLEQEINKLKEEVKDLEERISFLREQKKTESEVSVSEKESVDEGLARIVKETSEIKTTLERLPKLEIELRLKLKFLTENNASDTEKNAITKRLATISQSIEMLNKILMAKKQEAEDIFHNRGPRSLE